MANALPICIPHHYFTCKLSAQPDSFVYGSVAFQQTNTYQLFALRCNMEELIVS